MPRMRIAVAMRPSVPHRPAPSTRAAGSAVGGVGGRRGRRSAGSAVGGVGDSDGLVGAGGHQGGV
ncbi:hypothetical protein EF294_14155 [Gordonia oryzae]|uniref:Uncharacterized protein n=1 Tax=Gordonia oryzae TaxID=2487349 RepID=A0A3N4GC65_9ACTN|nr:hypothetical protein EF294_14155 [Gordonia oryzae]